MSSTLPRQVGQEGYGGRLSTGLQEGQQGASLHGFCFKFLLAFLPCLPSVTDCHLPMKELLPPPACCFLSDCLITLTNGKLQVTPTKVARDQLDWPVYKLSGLEAPTKRHRSKMELNAGEA